MKRLAPDLEPLDVSAEHWRHLGLKYLREPNIISRIGEKKTVRLRKLAEKAGKLLVHNPDTWTTARSRNGLYIVPISKDLPKNTNFTVRNRRDSVTIPLGRYAGEEKAHHISSDIKGTDLLVLPMTSRNLTTDTEKAAIFIHELIHADQLRRKNQPPQPKTLEQENTRHEAEGYYGQLAVLDHDWDGQLFTTVAANAQNSDIFTVYAPPAIEDAMGTSPALSNALGAAVRCAAHNYTPDGLALPSAELASEFLQLRLIGHENE